MSVTIEVDQLLEVEIIENSMDGSTMMKNWMISDRNNELFAFLKNQIKSLSSLLIFLANLTQ